MENSEDAVLIKYRTQGTCCQLMQVKIRGNIIEDADFLGGCNGNLLGIKTLIKGHNIDEIIEKFQGIECGDKPTSCPDQLAKCLISYKNEVLTHK